MTKKVLLMVVLALLAVTMVSAQDDPLAGIDPTGVNIVYWHEWQGDQQTGIDEVIRLFEESNEFGITVEQVQLGSGGAIAERLAAGIVSGDLPNLAGNGFVNSAQDLLLDGVLQTMEVYFNHPTYGLTADELALFDTTVINTNRSPLEPFNNELLAFPTGISAEVLYVNLEMLEALNSQGLVSFSGRGPQTLDEFREFACASTTLTDPSGNPVRGFPLPVSAFSMYPYIYGQGGSLFDAEANTYNFNNEGVINALSFWRQLIADECAYVFSEGFTSSVFGAAQVPMANGSSVGLPFVIQAIADSGSGLENWIMAPFPWSETPSLQTYLRGVMILNQTPEENLATWLFVKFWATNVEAQVAWTTGANYQPFYTPAREGLSEEFLAERPQFTNVFDIFGDENVVKYSVPSHPRSNEIHSITGDFFINAITTEEDIAALAQEATDAANEVYASVLEEIAEAAGN